MNRFPFPLSYPECEESSHSQTEQQQHIQTNGERGYEEDLKVTVACSAGTMAGTCSCFGGRGILFMEFNSNSNQTCSFHLSIGMPQAPRMNMQVWNRIPAAAYFLLVVFFQGRGMQLLCNPLPSLW